MLVKGGEMGIWGLARGKCFMTMPFRSLESTPFFWKSAIKRSKGSQLMGVFLGNSEIFELHDIKRCCIFYRFW